METATYTGRERQPLGKARRRIWSGAVIRIAQRPYLDDESRAMLASGRANPSVALFIETVLAMRGDQRPGETFAGAMLEDEAPAAMSEDALAYALAAIDGGRASERPASPVYPELARMPPMLVDAIRDAEARTGWKSIGSGVRQLSLREAGGVSAEILRMAEGAATPRHTHRGQEYTLCLVGTFSDAAGTYGPGDVAYADPSVTHQPVARGSGGPVFALTITDAGLQLTGVMGVLQRLIGR
jgi:putative transcriptional regulator